MVGDGVQDASSSILIGAHIFFSSTVLEAFSPRLLTKRVTGLGESDPALGPTRRACMAAALAVSAPSAAVAAKSRSDGYAVQRAEREWSYMLSGQQYFILRQGGTEAPNSSPLVREE